MRQITQLITILFLLAFKSAAQGEILTNAQIAEMSKAGLDKQVILKKINDTAGDFDVSTAALIELKKAGVETEIITLMMEKANLKKESTAVVANQNPLAGNVPQKDSLDNPQNYSENTPPDAPSPDKTIPTPQEALLRARSVALVKSSLQPSRQALEKELMKRREWQKYNLTILRYKEEADIYIEIGYVSLSWITHRYVFRIYDRRSGTIIAAGETTSWGSLASNLAREIMQKMEKVGAR